MAEQRTIEQDNDMWQTHFDHDATGYPCFYIHGLSGEQKRDEQALSTTARMIAAAPRMFEILKELTESGCDCGHCKQAHNVILYIERQA